MPDYAQAGRQAAEVLEGPAATYKGRVGAQVREAAATAPPQDLGRVKAALQDAFEMTRTSQEQVAGPAGAVGKQQFAAGDIQHLFTDRKTGGPSMSAEQISAASRKV